LKQVIPSGPRRPLQRKEDVMNKSTLIALSAFAVGPLTSAMATTSALSDAQIAAIVVTANQVDIDAGKLAAARSASPDVQTLAERMVVDHTSVNQKATDLVTRLKVTPAPNETSASLQRDGDANLARLRPLDGGAFDRAYVTNEIRYHQAVIDAMDNSLIPSAHNPELKALLVQVRPAFVSHLEHAKHVLNAMSAGKVQ
jgi:putative membrane protein